MNTLRYLIGLLAVATMMVIMGCSGPSAGLDPEVTFDFPGDTPLPFLPADSVLVIDGTAKVANAQSNPITSIRWTQDPEIGVFASETTLGTSWRVRPEVVGLIDEPTDVTLTVTVETLLGGRRVVPINLVLIPSVPQ